MTVAFVVTMEVASPVDVVFDLSLDIEAHTASMRSSGERAIAGVTTGRIGLGQEVTWRATHFHIPFTMTSRVTELDRPHRFVDEQVRGPFHAFHHEHQFAQTDDGCLMTDRVTFVAPFGPVGRVAEWALLGRYLQHLIETRNAYLAHTAQNHLRRAWKDRPDPDLGFGRTGSSPG